MAAAGKPKGKHASELEKLEATNRKLRADIKKSNSSNKPNGLGAYTTLPVAKKLYNLPKKYDGWEYRSRPTASSTEQQNDEEAPPRTHTRKSTKKSPAKAAPASKKEDEAAEAEEKKEEGEKEAGGGDDDDSKKGDAKADDTPPLELLDTWIYHSAKALLGALSSADAQTKGMLRGSKIEAVLLEAGCPQPDALKELLADAQETSMDYAKWVQAHKGAGLRAENKQRLGANTGPSNKPIKGVSKEVASAYAQAPRPKAHAAAAKAKASPKKTTKKKKSEEEDGGNKEEADSPKNEGE